ncbi:MAG: universal stress protein [Betaproteobacteria bacterium]|nr:universal stress protein [Betaproteobacteria bacterium]MDH5221839.1 universal stress protein [Betaproteobacteria bacterium]MDH5350114.1 universal stress protein [Betaproteobacteria bacterium]
MTIRSMLVASDFSEHARRAALRAGLLARELGLRRAVLLHAAPDSFFAAAGAASARRALRARLADLAREVRTRTGASLIPRLARGPVLDTLTRAAARFDMVVIGAQGQHPMRDFALGSTAERLVRRVHRPVLVVRRRPAHGYRQALVPVDFSADSRAALALAAGIAPRAELNVLHAFEVPFEGKMRFAGVAEESILKFRQQARREARAQMDALLAGPGLPRGRITLHLAHGYAPVLIARAQEEISTDLVAIGKHGTSALEDLLLGSVTLHMLAMAPCDVLVVPARRRAG